MTEPMTPEQALESLRIKFTSGNSIPVERASVTRAEYEAIHEWLAKIKARDAAVPVAWRADWPNWRQYHDADDAPLPESWDSPPTTITPLYTAPPAHPVSVPDGWVERIEKIKIAGKALRTMLGDGPHCEHLAAISGQAELLKETMLAAVPQPPTPEVYISPTADLDWAVDRWHVEVSERPLQNVHRRTLDDVWRQLIRHFGGDDVVLCGPCHDDLLTAAQEKDHE
jgi:hypothetical protein